MSEIFGPLRQHHVIPYLDDILIPSKTIEEGIELLRKVFVIIKDHGLTIKISKSSFLKENIAYLGYEISYNKVTPSPVKTAAVRSFQTPRSQHQLRQFLGLIGYFRKFIQNFARETSPLTKLLKKGALWKWTDTHTEIVNKLKQNISSQPILAIYNPKLAIIVYTDASREDFAAILTQNLDNKENPIAFFRKQTTKQEKNYHSFELELLAMVKTLERYRYYLIGNEFTIITDCNAVKNTIDKQKIVPRIARWILSLQDFSLKVVHRSGTQMKHIDALSRNFEEKTCETLVIKERDYLREAQDHDSTISDIKITLFVTFLISMMYELMLFTKPQRLVVLVVQKIVDGK